MYPEVYHSYRLYQLWDETPSVPYQPMPPEKPKFHMRGETSVLMFCMSLLGLISMLILVIAGIAGGEDIPSELWLIILMELVIAIACLVYNHFVYHQPLIEEYESELKDYPSRCEIINQERDRILSADNVRTYRESLVKKWLSERENGVSDIPGFKKYDDSDDVKVGKSEMAFYNLIKSNLPYTVRKDIKVPVAQTYYYPDIVVIARGLFIDIEIDEPYTDDDGKPIHYLDTSSDEWESVDMRRNRFMSKEGWEIIRFAEEQVVKYPQECVTFINNVIDALVKSGSQPKLVFPYPVDEWTKSEAEHYALVRYRDSYSTEHADCIQSENAVKRLDDKEREHEEFNNWYKRQQSFAEKSQNLTIENRGGYSRYNIKVKGVNENGIEADYFFPIWCQFFMSYCKDESLDYTHFPQQKTLCDYVERCKGKKGYFDTPIYDTVLSFIRDISDNAIVLFAGSGNEAVGTPYPYSINAYHFGYLRRELKNKGISYWEIEYDTFNIEEQQDIVIVEFDSNKERLIGYCEKIFNEFRAKHPCITYISIFKEWSSADMRALIADKNRQIREDEEKAEKQR